MKTLLPLLIFILFLFSIQGIQAQHGYGGMVAHSEPDFNSPFTTPVCLDSLDSTGINKNRNPKITCQFSIADNDSSNLTEIILAEKWII